MKKTLLSLAVGALLITAPRVASADVSVDFFYNNISGGSWIDVGDYGYCWQPEIAVSNTNWRPYSDGYWAYTDLGWTWVSYEDFGWATYHYGRWARLSDYGWVWVPGRDADLEWGPAWVSWRTGGNYIGWAPLPPETIALVGSRPITGHIDVEFNIGPAYYNFVDVRYIGEPVLRERIYAPAQNITYIQQTVNVTNITYQNNTVYNYGPDINVVNRTAARPVQRLRLERQQNVDVATAAKSGGLTKVQGDKLMVAAPARVNRSARQMAPQNIKTKVAAAKVDRGWSGVGDEKAQAEFKQKMRNENPKNVPPPTAAGDTTQASAGGSPPAATASPAGTGEGAAAGAAGQAGASPASGTPQEGQGGGRRALRRGAAVGAAAQAASSPEESPSSLQGGGSAKTAPSSADTKAKKQQSGRGQGRQHQQFPQQGADTVAPGAASQPDAGAAATDAGERSQSAASQGGNAQQGAGKRARGGQAHQQTTTGQESENQNSAQSQGRQGHGQGGGAHAQGQGQKQGMDQGGGEQPQGQGRGRGKGRAQGAGGAQGEGQASPSPTP